MAAHSITRTSSDHRRGHQARAIPMAARPSLGPLARAGVVGSSQSHQLRPNRASVLYRARPRHGTASWIREEVAEDRRRRSKFGPRAPITMALWIEDMMNRYTGTDFDDFL